MALSTVQAGTIAHWNFEEGPERANVARGGLADGVFYPGILDQSGNGNHLSTWSDGGGGGYLYHPDVAVSTIPLTGAANNYSVKNTGGGPAMFTETGGALQTWTPLAWTIEVSFQPEDGGWRTMVGRDSRAANTQGNDVNLAALYFQITPDDQLAIKFTDVAGYWHEAVSVAGLIPGFNWPTDNEGTLGQWQTAAAVSDGSTLSLWYRNIEAGDGWSLVAQTDLTASGSSDTRLTPGTGDGGDWDAGNFSVGRGLYNGGHGDRAYGFIDEVRFSDTALTPFEFLMVPEPSSLALALMGFGLAVAQLGRKRA
jgi:hypothetical protein